MRYGVTMFVTDVSIDVVELAREAEARGLGSLWLPEHSHIPTTRKTPYPGSRDGVLPDEYRRCLDPLVALAAVAAATTTLRLGTGILLAAQRDPIVTAKALATLDHVSGGRAAVGVGYGWNEDEMNDHGVDYRARRQVTREHVLAMDALWREEEASFDGEHVSFGPSWAWPKPAQHDRAGAPHIPVLLGGAAGPKLFAAVADWADGWMPIGGAGMTAALPELRRVVEEAGRDPGDLEIIPFGSIPDPGKLDHFAEIGVTETVFMMPSAGRDRILPLLDRFADLVAGRGN
jgi:probable F420-dependent oxidoreductase